MTGVQKKNPPLEACISKDTQALEVSPSFSQYQETEYAFFQSFITSARQLETSPQLLFSLANELDKKEEAGVLIQAQHAFSAVHCNEIGDQTTIGSYQSEGYTPITLDALQGFSNEDNPWLSLTVEELLPEDISAQHVQQMERSGRYPYQSCALSGKTAVARVKTSRYRVILLFVAIVVTVVVGFYTGWLPEKLTSFLGYTTKKTIKFSTTTDNSLRKNATLKPDTTLESFPLYIRYRPQSIEKDRE